MINLLVVLIASIQLMASATDGATGKSAIYSLKEVDNHWAVFKKTHSKKYDNSTHEMTRKAKFHQNLIKINEHNTRYNNGSDKHIFLAQQCLLIGTPKNLLHS